MTKQLHYNIDFNLFTFLKHYNISVFSFFKQRRRIVLYFKVYSNTLNSFVVKKVVLENIWFTFFFKYLGVKNKSLFLLNTQILKKKGVFKLFFSFLGLLKKHLISLNYGWSVQLNLIGLGYKTFLYKNSLYFRLGFCRMIAVRLPIGIKVLSKRKESVKFLSDNKVLLGNFISYLKSLRKFNLYKGKGLYELKDFSTIKLKVGKQQQMF